MTATWDRIARWVLKDVHWRNTFALRWVVQDTSLTAAAPPANAVQTIASSFQVSRRLLTDAPPGWWHWPDHQRAWQHGLAIALEGAEFVSPMVWPEPANLPRARRPSLRKEAAARWLRARKRISRWVYEWTEEGSWDDDD